MGLELTRVPEGDDFVLTDDGTELARILLRPGIVVRLDGRTLAAEKYMPGFNLAFVDDEGDPDDPLAWYAGGGGFGGGRIVIAPDREYRVRSRFPLGTQWRVLDGRKELLRARATKRWPDARFGIERRDEPSLREDSPLVLAVLAVVLVLQAREPAPGSPGP
jgi:hypothetical protein